MMTYWTVGAFVSARLRQAQWGAKTVEALCDYLKTHNPKRRGFGKRQIYNMVQFYDTYTLPEYQVISERLRLHEFVQMPSAQIEGCLIVHSANAQLSDNGEGNLGTDPTKVNKIKGLRGFGGRARAEGRKRDFLRGLPAFSAGLLALLACLWCT